MIYLVDDDLESWAMLHIDGPAIINSKTVLFLHNCLNFNFLLVLQNKEAEKQLKFFQSSVAAAFAERDQALMEVWISLVQRKQNECNYINIPTTTLIFLFVCLFVSFLQSEKAKEHEEAMLQKLTHLENR